MRRSYKKSESLNLYDAATLGVMLDDVAYVFQLYHINVFANDKKPSNFIVL